MNPKILFVTGKGGVGKTSVSIMLGLKSASKGIKTLIVQTYGAQRISSFFQKPPAQYTPQQIYTNLYTMSITADQAIEEYALQQLKFRKLYQLIFENRFAKPLINGAPGLHDAVHLGKIFDLVEREKWPQIIVDAPATGHAISMLRSAKTMMELTKVGPMYNSNKLVHDLFSNPKITQLILVTLLEHLPVQETRSLWNNLGSALQKQCQSLFCNKVIASPPHSPIDLAPDWKEVADNLSVQYTRQQELYGLLNDIPLPKIQIPILSDHSVHSWTNLGFSK